MEKEQDSGPEITWDLHKERKHSLLMATGDCSPFLLPSSTLMSISVFNPQMLKKKRKILLGLHTGNEIQETQYQNTALD